MTGRYQTYPEYKESQIDWIGSIPATWHIDRFKYAINLIESGKRSSVDNSEVLSIGGEHIGFNGKLRLENLKYVSESFFKTNKKGRVSKGDILIVKDGATIGKTAYVDTEIKQKMLLNEHVYRVVSHKYDYYFILSSYFQAKIWSGNNSSAQEGLTLSTINNIPHLSPSKKEKELIANFLDHETDKLDILIEKQQQLIKLLKEKRQAVISHAVTKGLNPQSPMRDSGIEWLGEVPEHWKVVSLKHLVSAPIIDGPHLTPTKRDEGIPFISAEAISQGYINFDKKWGYISKEDHELYSKRYSPQKDDILMVKLGATTGVVAMVETNEVFNVWVPLATIRPREDISSKFIFYLLQSSSVRDAIQLSWTYGTQQTLGLGTLANLSLPTPPEEESYKIVELIESKIPLYDESVRKCEISLQYIQERRTALISAAVTGKIDVRSWQPPESSTQEIINGR